jgi:hypothetical protein
VIKRKKNIYKRTIKVGCFIQEFGVIIRPCRHENKTAGEIRLFLKVETSLSCSRKALALS